MATEPIEKVNRRHIGRNVQKIRTYLGVKQKALALDLGISQTKVWKIESKEKIEEGLLSRIAGILSVSPEVIREFDEKRAINNINNYKVMAISEEKNEPGSPINLIEKITELYKRLLQSERESPSAIPPIIDRKENRKTEKIILYSFSGSNF